jgi:hypothetical protein
MTEAPPLLFGPYAAPALRRGDRATCLYRGALCSYLASHLTRRSSKPDK